MAPGAYSQTRCWPEASARQKKQMDLCSHIASGSLHLHCAGARRVVREASALPRRDQPLRCRFFRFRFFNCLFVRGFTKIYEFFIILVISLCFAMIYIVSRLHYSMHRVKRSYVHCNLYAKGAGGGR